MQPLQDETIVILPADKGKAIVIMDRDDYWKKISDMLEDPRTYKKLKHNPTTKIEKCITQSLKVVKKNRWIPDELRLYFTPNSQRHPKSMDS